MWALLLLVIVLLAIVLGQRHVPLTTFVYYFQLLAFGLVTQFGFLLPFLYFPFRPFDYRNAK